MWANPAELWIAFLKEVDASLEHPVQLHLIGGFVLTFVHGAPRYTGDVDCVAVIPADRSTQLLEAAGKGSPIAARTKIYLELVTVADLPDDYEGRLEPVLAGRFLNLELFALGPYDIVLSKLGRNSGKDRADVEYLAKHLNLNGSVVTERFRKEMRPWVANAERHELTIKLWCEDYFRD
jgi:hypothetical protein